MKNRTVGVAAALGMLILILDSKTALAGAAEGMELCLKTVIPAIFPFILLSNLLTSAFYGVKIPLFSKISRLFHMPEEISFLLVPAFLGGYPVGAQCIHSLYSSGLIGRDSAERMLPFLSNVGPSFLFGILLCKFQSEGTIWKIWIIQILSACTAAQFFRIYISLKGIPERQASGNTMEQAIKTMVKVCGWILIFRIMISFLDRWFLWLLPRTFKVLLIGLLELSNGCCILDQIPNEGIRFIIGNGILAFGGICVLYQTAAVCTGLRIHYYLVGKGIQMLCAGILAVFMQAGLWYLLPILALILIVMSNRQEKKSGFPSKIAV